MTAGQSRSKTTTVMKTSLHNIHSFQLKFADLRFDLVSLLKA